MLFYCTLQDNSFHHAPAARVSVERPIRLLSEWEVHVDAPINLLSKAPRCAAIHRYLEVEVPCL